MGLQVVNTVILLATYNGLPWIREQLDSLRAQRDVSFRVLMQDDGSTDGTLRILEETAAADARFQLLPVRHGSAGAAGNFCSLMARAEADLYFFCDQDDLWEPDKLHLFLEAYKGTDPALPTLLHCDAALIDADGQPLGDSFFRRQGWDPSATSLARLLVQNNVTGCCMMINRALRDLAVRYVQPEKLFMHDWFLAQTAAAFGQIRFLPRPLVRYRQHGHNVLGASKSGPAGRALQALKMPEKARERIRLTYRQAEVLRETYGAALPPAAEKTLRQYLETESMHKIRRVLTVRRRGYRMQSPVFRAGQLFFG